MRNKILALFFLLLFVITASAITPKMYQNAGDLNQWKGTFFQYTSPTELFYNTPGMVILKVSGSCPPGFTEDTSFDGRALIGTTVANGNVATNTGNATQTMTTNVGLLALGTVAYLNGPTTINLTPLSRRVIVCTN